MGLNGPILFGASLMLILLSIALLPLHLYVISAFLAYFIDYMRLDDAASADRLFKLALLMCSMLIVTLLLIYAGLNNTKPSPIETSQPITIDRF